MKKRILNALLLTFLILLAITSCDKTTAKTDNNDTTSTEQITESPCDHNYKSKTTIRATCVSDGEKTFTCSKCNDSYTETIAATGKHQYTKKTTTEATCTKEGVETYTCYMCNDFYTKTIAATGKHNWRSATCSAPQTCLVCKGTQGVALEHSWKPATCAAPQTCTKCYETIGTKSDVHVWKNATCILPKTCQICKITEGVANGHTLDAGKCTICKVVDKESDSYKYAVLKKKADVIATACAETVISKQLKDPSSMKIFSQDILASDDYFRYYVKIRYSAKNSYGGTVTSDAYILVRVHPAMDGKFDAFYSSYGFEFTLSESDRISKGWGTQPEDWSLDAVQKYENPPEVSIKMLIAYPEKYEGQYVKITEVLVLRNNYISDKRIYAYQSTGSGKYDYNTSNNIDIFYRMCDNLDDLIMIDADYQKITVYGVIKTYSNSTEAYIEAYEIIIH